MDHLASTEAAYNGRSDDGLAAYVLQSATGANWRLIYDLLPIITSSICIFATVAARVQKRAPNEPEQRARDEPERQAQRDDPLLAPRYNLRPRRGRAPEPVLDPAPQQEQECEGNGLCLHLEHDDDGHIKKLHTCALPANAHEYTIKKSHKKTAVAQCKLVPMVK